MRQIVYFSTASGRQDAIVVAGILAASRANNLHGGITGLLVAGGHRYLQVVEGPYLTIGRLMATLRRDERHVGMTVLVDRRIGERNFDGWSMGYNAEPRLGEFATFGDLAAQMRANLPDPRLREKIDCFVRTFATADEPIDVPLWPVTIREPRNLIVDGRH